MEEKSWRSIVVGSATLPALKSPPPPENSTFTNQARPAGALTCTCH